ncbi:T9SS type A sorting domain-containing protein [Spirosoma sp. BT704]|uniref:T9SS type A sorting domain-containing protein n=2 Tax=Spirosoma validum TaxID=2771355 RepID=A0A927B5U7_9BACT|nr:T9SS type A sorting domain-containing protein [Spirosoma validum]
MFYVGSGFSSGPTNPNNGDTYARLGIALSPAGSGQFQVRTVPSGGGGTTSASFSGRQTITFAMNNSGATLNYVSPTGSMETLPDDTYDIWIGTIKFANDQSVLTPGQTINNFKFRINDGVGVMQIGDIRIRDINGVLPVTLLSFTAKPEGDRVQLAWSTTMERNADRFVIERSADLSEYVEVGEVIAKGTTDERQNYGLTDLNPQPGVNYYRLKQIDLDGTVHEYKPISAILKADEPVVTLFPNPANPDRIHLRLWNADSAVIQLFDAMGQPVNLRLERQPGSADLLFNHPLTPGIYWINVQMNGQKQTIKVLIR